MHAIFSTIPAAEPSVSPQSRQFQDSRMRIEAGEVPGSLWSNSRPSSLCVTRQSRRPKPSRPAPFHKPVAAIRAAMSSSRVRIMARVSHSACQPEIATRTYACRPRSQSFFLQTTGVGARVCGGERAERFPGCRASLPRTGRSPLFSPSCILIDGPLSILDFARTSRKRARS